MDMPEVRPRNMADNLAKLVETHVAVQDNIAKAAAERAAYHAERDKKLNAEAKLHGKVNP